MSSFNTSAGDNGQLSGSAPQGTFTPGATAADQPAGSTGGNTGVDIAKLIKRLDDSQAFIETLKTERQEDRRLIEELKNKQGPSLDEIKDIISQARATGQDSSVDADSLVKQVYDKVNTNLTQKEVAERETANFNEVAKALSVRFGDKVDEQVNAIAAENGLDFDAVVALAKRSPKAALKLLGVESKTPPPTPTRGSTVPNGITPVTPQRAGSIMSVRTEKERMDMFSQRLNQQISKN